MGTQAFVERTRGVSGHVSFRPSFATFAATILFTALGLTTLNAAADEENQPEAYVTRTPEELAAEKAYVDAQASAEDTFVACVTKSRGSVFGIGASDPNTACANERAQFARYLPADQSGAIMDDIQAKALNGGAPQ